MQLYLFLSSQAAAEYVKTRLPDVLKQHLQNYEKEKENSLLSYQSILEQQILNVDKEMLEKLSATYDEAGEMLCCGKDHRNLDKDLVGSRTKNSPKLRIL